VGDALALTALAAWLWPRRRSPVAQALIGLLLALALYVAGHTWALAGGSPAHIERVLWLKYAGVCFSPPFAGFLFAELTGWNRYLSRRLRLGLLAAAAGLALLNLTNGLHGWFHAGVVSESGNGWVTNRLLPGPGYVLHKLWLAGTCLFGLFATAGAWRGASPLQRRQMLLLLAALLPPWIVNLLYHAGFSLLGPHDASPFFLAPFAALLAWSVARDGLSRVAPIARNTLIEELDDGMVVTDANRMVVDANPAARRLLNLPSAAAGSSLGDVLQGHPALLERCLHADDGRWTHAPADGNFWRLTWRPLHPARGKPLGFMLLIHDLSDLQRAEQALRRSEARHRLLLDHSTDLIWNLDAQGVFTYVSPAWERVLGYPAASMVGAAFQPLIHPDDLPACLDYLQAMVRDCRPKPSPEYRVRHADGSWQWHAANAMPVLADDGRFLSMVGVSRDITQERQAKEERERLLRDRTELWQEATWAALGAGEEEARRIGRELHDTLCQDLIGLARQARALAEASAAAVTTPDPHAAAGTLRWLADQAVAAARRARDLSHVLACPAADSDIPLDEALDGQLHPLERLYDITCELSLDEAFPALPPESAGHLIRIIREAVVNAARHGQAKRVWVDGLRQENGAMISISSDGIAEADPATWQAGLGLRQMRLRAGLLNASLTFRPAEQGVVVELHLPDPATRKKEPSHVP
jgi:PAS domain S-box-containing protein